MFLAWAGIRTARTTSRGGNQGWAQLHETQTTQPRSGVLSMAAAWLDATSLHDITISPRTLFGLAPPNHQQRATGPI